MLGTRPVMVAIGQGLWMPGWFALGAGAVLLALHWLVRQRSAAAAKLPQIERRHAAHRVSQTLSQVEPTLEPATREARSPAPALAHERLTHWNPEVFAAIEWRRFEAVVEALFAQAGFETRAQTHGADGGVDVWLHSRHAGGAPVGVVQCKHWQGKPVPVSAMREFFGVMASHGLKRGTYATTSRFTPEALAFANANGINAQDGDGLLKLIATRTPEQQSALLAMAFDGEYWRPTCASCGMKMAERTARSNGKRFWGCVNFPHCKATLPMPAATGAA
ncbi:restriction endonuclease [Ottowia testudinis]|uniref:Restriction endonuclease n=1 Tax=Ottowia testudinis TaxID=2816950 RepID=A0A975CCU0_9BURK|nr:restriction endonuclease [Ottowia testudinis]QTD44030.1 restriction endonuclease [Ottowia testudinis]